MANLVAALILLLLSSGAWGGLGWLVTTVPPAHPLAMPTFYLFAFCGLASGTALLAWLLLRPRDYTGQTRSPLAFVGHAMLLATIVLFALWLQSLRMLTVTAALLLVGLYVFLELALLFGTRGSVDMKVPTRQEAARAEY